MAGMDSGDLAHLMGLRRVGPRLIGEVAWSVLLKRRRSLADDAQRVAAHLNRPVLVEGAGQVPARDPFVLAVNHFQAPGLWIGWVAAAITAAVATAREPGRRDLHWITISEWRWFEVAGRWVANPATALLFPRACEVWGLIPTPAKPADVSGRAAALRKVLAVLGRRSRGERGAGEPVGILPEGTATVSLREARPGSGAFLHRVGRLGVPLLPVGVHQAEGALVIRFGEPFLLGDPPPSETRQLDDWARERVMVAVGRLLPRDLWGVYAGAIERAGD